MTKSSIRGFKEFTQKNGEQVSKVYLAPTYGYGLGRNYFYISPDKFKEIEHEQIRLRKKNFMPIVTKVEPYEQVFKELDFKNKVSIDLTNQNLEDNSNVFNRNNRFDMGYEVKHGVYIPTVFVMKDSGVYRRYSPIKACFKEDECCIAQSRLEREFKDPYEYLNTVYKFFDFKEYMVDDFEILDLERTGQISHEEAIYRHILNIKDNAWYYLRFGLEDYYKENKIPVPEYDIDVKGRMIGKDGKKLCPFTY